MKKKVARTAVSTQLTATAVATKSVALSADAAPVELVLLPVLPASPFATVDSRSDISFVYDAEALATRYNAAGRKANLNIEHNMTGDTRSRGYCVELTTAALEPGQGMEDGLLYGWFAPSVLGTEELAQRLWLYTSAEVRGVWLDEKTLQLTKFDGHALTNTPATEMPANFTAEAEAEEDDTPEDASSGAAYTQEQTAAEQQMLTAILEQLGLPADATQEQVLEALSALRTPASTEAEQALTAAGFTAADLTAGVLVRSEQLTAATEQVQTLTAQVGTLTTDLATATADLTAARAEVTTLKSAETERQVFAAVDAAIAARKATPAQREALARIAKADLAAFNDAMAAAPEVLAATAPIHQAASDANGLTAEQLAFCKTHRIDPAIYAKNLSTI